MTQIPTTCGHAVLQVLAFAGWMTAKAIADAHNSGTREGVGPTQVYQLYSWKQVRAAISGMGEACARVDRHWVDRKRRTDGGTGYLYRITDAGLSKLRELQLEAYRNRVTVDYECISVDGRPAGVIVGLDFAIDIDMDVHYADAIPYHWITSPDQTSRLAHHLDPTRGRFNCRGAYVMPKPPMSLFDAVTISRKVLDWAAKLPGISLSNDPNSGDVRRAYETLANHHATMPRHVAGDTSAPGYYDQIVWRSPYARLSAGSPPHNSIVVTWESVEQTGTATLTGLEPDTLYTVYRDRKHGTFIACKPLVTPTGLTVDPERYLHIGQHATALTPYQEIARKMQAPWPKFQEKTADQVEFQWGFPTAAQIATERRDRGHRVAPTSSRQRLRDTVLYACKQVFGLSGAEAESLRGLRVRATLEQYGRFVALVGGSAVALNTRPSIVEAEEPKQQPVDLTGRKG